MRGRVVHLSNIFQPCAGGVVKVFDLLMVPYTFYLAWRDMRTGIYQLTQHFFTLLRLLQLHNCDTVCSCLP